MANEITIRSQLSIKNGNLNYRSSPPGSFQANMTGIAGPVPGSLLITTAGVDISLAALTALGGVCNVTNVDPANYVMVGLAYSGSFYPLQEVLPGENYIFRLSRLLGNQLGSGTTSTATGVTFHIRAVGGTCRTIVEAFDQ